MHLAWAGPTEPGAPLYYRLQGPRLLIEYDNTQRAANHAHSVWRDPEADFGYDALGAHLTRHHRLQVTITIRSCNCSLTVPAPSGPVDSGGGPAWAGPPQVVETLCCALTAPG